VAKKARQEGSCQEGSCEESSKEDSEEGNQEVTLAIISSRQAKEPGLWPGFLRLDAEAIPTPLL